MEKIFLKENFCDEKNFFVHRRCVCSVSACRCSSPLCLQSVGASAASTSACRCSSPLCLQCGGVSAASTSACGCSSPLCLQRGGVFVVVSCVIHDNGKNQNHLFLSLFPKFQTILK